MNKEYKYNVLSKTYIDDVRRNLLTMESDDLTKLVFLKSMNNQVFSSGTDLKCKLSFNVRFIL